MKVAARPDCCDFVQRLRSHLGSVNAASERVHKATVVLSDRGKQNHDSSPVMEAHKGNANNNSNS